MFKRANPANRLQPRKKFLAELHSPPQYFIPIFQKSCGFVHHSWWISPHFKIHFFLNMWSPYNFNFVLFLLTYKWISKKQIKYLFGGSSFKFNLKVTVIIFSKSKHFLCFPILASCYFVQSCYLCLNPSNPASYLLFLWCSRFGEKQMGVSFRFLRLKDFSTVLTFILLIHPQDPYYSAPGLVALQIPSSVPRLDITGYH